MKHVLLSFLFLLLCNLCSFAQSSSSPYEESRRIGIEAYNKGKYEYALKCFGSVLKIAPTDNDLTEWIGKCKKAIQQKKDEAKDKEVSDKARKEVLNSLNVLLKKVMSNGDITNRVESEIQKFQINNGKNKYITSREQKSINRLLDGLIEMSRQRPDGKLIRHWINKYHVIPITWDNLDRISSQVHNIIE